MIMKVLYEVDMCNTVKVVFWQEVNFMNVGINLRKGDDNNKD